MNATWEEASPLALPADEVPAHPGGVAAPAGLVLATGDPVPRPVVDVPQALDVDVHELARTLALVAAGRLDAFSRRIVGWSVDSTQTTVLVTNALGMATRRRDPAGGLVVRTDRGVQVTFWAFSQKVCARSRATNFPARGCPTAQSRRAAHEGENPLCKRALGHGQYWD